MRPALMLLLVLALGLPACDGSADGPPTSIVCEVLSWEDPQAVAFSLDVWDEFLNESIDIAGLTVEFEYYNRTVSFDAIDTTEGKRDFIGSGSRFLPPGDVDLETVGIVVLDDTRKHLGVAIDYRVRCETA